MSNQNQSQFEQQIQQWILLDNQLKSMNEKVKEMRDKKSSLSENLIKYADSNDLKNRTIQWNDTKIKFHETKVASLLTFKYIEKSLKEIIKNEQQVKQILDYLKDHREFKTVSDIVRK